MLRKILPVSVFAACLTAGCTSYKPSISAACEENSQSAILKWETFPVMKGELKVYASSDPDNIPLEKPIATTSISEQMLMVRTNGRMDRMYYTMVFNDEFPITIASRRIYLPGTQNFRDIGGYFTTSGREVKWGMVYRSDALDSIGSEGERILRGLGVKTIIDLRPQWEQDTLPCDYKRAEVISIPIESQNSREVVQRIQNGEIRKGDAFLAMQDEYIQFVSRNSDAFAKALRLFQEPQRYPILISCSFGKDQSGFLSMLLLNLLDMDPETIRKDYMSSNDYINTGLFAQWASQLSSDSQESVTVLLMAHEELIDILKHQVEKEYGSLDNYITQRLRLSEKEQNKIKEILLY